MNLQHGTSKTTINCDGINITSEHPPNIIINNDPVLTKTQLIDLFYPVGSIYISMNNTNPSTIFGGTWSQIINRFLWCTNTSKTAGGSKKITVDNMPSHTHSTTVLSSGDHRHGILSEYDDGNMQQTEQQSIPTGERNSIPNDVPYDGTPVKSTRNTYTQNAGSHNHTVTVNNTGKGTDYMPPYISVYCWQRTA